MTNVISPARSRSRFPKSRCIHRGKVIGSEPVMQAGQRDKVLPVYACHVHKACLAVPSARTEIACCVGCKDQNISRAQLSISIANAPRLQTEHVESIGSREDKTKDSNRYEIDVFMPYYNNLQHVPAAIDSVLWQVNTKPLLHLVNDCSLEDDTFLKDKYGQIENIRWYRTHQNLGPFAIANALSHYCESDFIAIRDADDICCPDSFRQLIDTLSSQQGDIIGGKMTQFVDPLDQASKRLIESAHKTPYVCSGARVSKFRYPRIINGTMILPKEIFHRLNGYNGDFVSAADIELIVRAHFCDLKLIYSDQVVGLRRLCHRSLSQNRMRHGIGSRERAPENEESGRRYRLWESNRGLAHSREWGTLDKSTHLVMPVRPTVSEREGQTYACIATIPRRIYALEKTIASLIDQVDSIKLYLNNYCHVPEFMKRDKIEVIFGDNTLKGSTRFYWADKVSGYFFACDDDLIYPPDYIAKSKTAINKYRCICGSHGSQLNQGVITNYYKERRVFEFNSAVIEDTTVDVLGAGTACFHTDDISISMDDLNLPGREDFALFKTAYNKSYDLLVFAHPKGWIRSATNRNDDGLYGEALLDCAAETRLANKYRSRRRSSARISSPKRILLLRSKHNYLYLDDLEQLFLARGYEVDKQEYHYGTREAQLVQDIQDNNIGLIITDGYVDYINDYAKTKNRDCMIAVYDHGPFPLYRSSLYGLDKVYYDAHSSYSDAMTDLLKGRSDKQALIIKCNYRNPTLNSAVHCKIDKDSITVYLNNPNWGSRRLSTDNIDRYALLERLSNRFSTVKVVTAFSYDFIADQKLQNLESQGKIILPNADRQNVAEMMFSSDHAYVETSSTLFLLSNRGIKVMTNELDLQCKEQELTIRSFAETELKNIDLLFESTPIAYSIDDVLEIGNAPEYVLPDEFSLYAHYSGDHFVEELLKVMAQRN